MIGIHVACNALTTIVVSASVSTDMCTDFMPVSCVKMVSSIPVSVERNSVGILSWKAVSSNSFRSIPMVSYMAWGCYANLIAIGGVEMVTAIPVTV